MQGWVRLILAAMVLVVTGCAIVGGVLLAQTNSRTTELVDRIQPARSVAFQLQSALLDQETGVRGYALSGDRSFLEPYEQGRTDERLFTRALGSTVAYDRTLADDLERITRVAGQWRREDAEPLITAASTHGRDSASAEGLNRSKEQFDELRRLFTVQQDHLDRARDLARAALDHTRRLRDAVFIAMLSAFVLAVVGLGVLLHHMVGRPLKQLREASDGVRAGAFDKHIESSGPSDVRAVGAAVQDMRGRLAEEIAAIRSRETLLADQAEELRRSNSELEQFAYVASHDLQEPLRKVASFCQQLEKRYGDQLDSRGQQYIDFAVDGAKRMQVLINDLLTFSRVGRVHDAWQTVPMEHVLDRALGNLELAVEESDVTLVRQHPLPEVKGDPTTLAMLWQNLIGSAIKFRRQDEPCRITIGCVRQESDWHLSVTDNGIGVAPEFAEKVFIIFQRLHARDAYDGTGIGLALCRKIVEFHGGRIRLESPRDGGTRIHFTVPVLPDEPAGEPPDRHTARQDTSAALLTTPPGAAE